MDESVLIIGGSITQFLPDLFPPHVEKSQNLNGKFENQTNLHLQKLKFDV